MGINKRTSRSGVKTAIVEYGIRLSITEGREAASKFLLRAGVPVLIARRVLVYPDRRRKTVELEAGQEFWSWPRKGIAPPNAADAEKKGRS